MRKVRIVNCKVLEWHINHAELWCELTADDFVNEELRNIIKALTAADILDTWGSDGWELVQVIPAPGTGEQLVAYMKRAVA